MKRRKHRMVTHWTIGIVVILVACTCLGGIRVEAAKAPIAQSVAGASASFSKHKEVVDLNRFPGTDLGMKLQAADTALGENAALFEISTSGSLQTPVMLSAGHDLEINVPVTWSATVRLAGRNSVSCGAGGAVEATVPSGVPLLRADGVEDFVIHDCAFRFSANSPVLAADGVRSLSMSHLSVKGGSLAQINADHGDDSRGSSQNLDFSMNSVHDAPNTGGAAILLVNTKQVKVLKNVFEGISTGTQWWGGDSAKGTLPQVMRTGELTLTGNRCDAVTACLWGSMGYSIEVSGNTADECSDVCFDTEGGRDTVLSNNTATHCGNGCGAIFFFSTNVSFRDNHFSGDARGGGLIFIKNRSADPRSHTQLNVIHNVLTCLTLCNAFYQEALSSSSFESNLVTNGVFTTAGFGQNISITRNQFRFTTSLPPPAAVISAPSITGGTSLTLEDNTIESTVPQGSDAACIHAVWNDYNNVDSYFIRKNRCGGTFSFPIDILTETAGANPGVHADWHLENNLLGSGKIVHQRTTTNEVYTAVNNCAASGCKR